MTSVQQASDLIKQKKLQEAEILLRQIVAQEPNNLDAWLWLSGVVSDLEERQKAIFEAYKINPQHPLVQKGIQRIQADLEKQKTRKPPQIQQTSQTDIFSDVNFKFDFEMPADLSAHQTNDKPGPPNPVDQINETFDFETDSFNWDETPPLVFTEDEDSMTQETLTASPMQTSPEPENDHENAASESVSPSSETTAEPSISFIDPESISESESSSQQILSLKQQYAMNLARKNIKIVCSIF